MCLICYIKSTTNWVIKPTYIYNCGKLTDPVLILHCCCLNNTQKPTFYGTVNINNKVSNAKYNNTFGMNEEVRPTRFLCFTFSKHFIIVFINGSRTIKIGLNGIN